MLSLVLGSEITDASVAAIASSYPNLELLDLSGYVFSRKPSCIRLLIRYLTVLLLAPKYIPSSAILVNPVSCALLVLEKAL